MIDMLKSESEKLLHNARVGRLSMVDPDGRPYVIPLRFLWTDKTVYVRLAPCGRKQDAIERSNHVCFETDEVRPDFSEYASVVIEGRIEDVSDEEEKKRALVAMNDKYARLCQLPTPGPNPVTKGVAIRKIVIEKLSGRKREPD